VSTGAGEATADVALDSGLASPIAAIERGPIERAAPRPRADSAGALALATLVLASLATVIVASGQQTILVPQSWITFPNWLAGPLHPLTHAIAVRTTPTAIGFSAVLVAMTAAYGVAVAAAPQLRLRLVAGAILALHVVWLLAPLMPLTDVFNYLGYARLGTVHGLDPYAHGIAAAPHDPTFPLATWHHLRSPYGPLFTLASFALGPLPLPLAYWLLKGATVAASLGCVALLWRCACQLGREPLRPVLLYAANPLVLAYGLGGFHNDVFLLLAALGAVSLVLARRDGRAGAALTAAIAVKASAGVLLPFLLLGARRRGRFLAGAFVAAVPVAVLSALAFGGTLPNLGDQSSLLSSFSVPNTLGQLVGLGGAPPWLLTLCTAALVGTLGVLAWRTWQRRIGWLEAGGWATLALIASLAWLQPWYVMWLLPFAALADSEKLRRWTLILCAWLLLTFMPTTGLALDAIGYKPMQSAVGRASVARMHALLGAPLRESRGHAAVRASGRHHRREQRRGAHPLRDGRAHARADGAQRARS
jgi:glycosyl transferase family 87